MRIAVTACNVTADVTCVHIHTNVYTRKTQVGRPRVHSNGIPRKGIEEEEKDAVHSRKKCCLLYKQ